MRKLHSYIAPLSLPLLSGVLLLLSGSVIDIWLCVIPGLVCYFFFHIARERGVWITLLSSLLAFLPPLLGEFLPLFDPHGSWWPTGSTIYGLPSMTVFWICFSVLVLIAGVMSALPALFYHRYKVFRSHPAVYFAIAFSVIELVRSEFLFGGNMIATLGAPLVETMYLKYLASLGGPLLLTAFVVLLSAWIAELGVGMSKANGRMFARLMHAYFDKARMRSSVAISLIVIASVGYGLWRDLLPRDTAPRLRVAVVSSDISLGQALLPGAYRTYRAITLSALEKNPDLLVYPENTFPYLTIEESTGGIAPHPAVFMRQTNEVFEDLRALSRMHASTTFAVPMHTTVADLLYNSVVFYRAGDIVGIYHKQHLVPFNEFSPPFLPMRLYEEIAKDDRDAPLITVRDIPISVVISSELARYVSSRGATIVIAPSNELALGGWGTGAVMDRLARIFALSGNVTVLHAARGGHSGVIDPNGVIIAPSIGTGVVVTDL